MLGSKCMSPCMSTTHGVDYLTRPDQPRSKIQFGSLTYGKFSKAQGCARNGIPLFTVTKTNACRSWLVYVAAATIHVVTSTAMQFPAAACIVCVHSTTCCMHGGVAALALGMGQRGGFAHLCT